MRQRAGNSKRVQELARRDAQFCQRLLPRLRDCEAGFGTLLFVAEADAGMQLPRYVRDPDAEELLAEAMAIAAERAALALDAECLASRYIAACAQLADLHPGHAQGPRRMATELLHWLDRHAIGHGLEIGG